MSLEQNTNIKLTRIPLFDPNAFPPEYQKMSIDEIANEFNKALRKAVDASETSISGLLGTICLADGRQAKVELKIDAEYIVQESLSAE